VTSVSGINYICCSVIILLNLNERSLKLNMQCTHSITLRRVRATIVAVEKL